jgi:hypothetical protein
MTLGARLTHEQLLDSEKKDRYTWRKLLIEARFFKILLPKDI